MKSSTAKLRTSQRKTNCTGQNENSLNSLACVTMLNEMKDARVRNNVYVLIFSLFLITIQLW